MAARALVWLAGLLLPFAAGAAPKRDLDLERISAQWSTTISAATREMAPLPAAEVDRLLEHWRANPVRKDEDRLIISRLAEARIALFKASVALERDRRRSEQLDDERSAILLKASQRDAELARLEAEKLRLQNLMRQEEAERLQQQAESNAADLEAATLATEQALAEAESARRLADAQAREAALARREAELLSAETVDLRAQLAGLRPESSPRGRMLVLGDVFFATGQGELKDEARTSIAPVKAFIDRYPGLPIAIEGHTDDRGSAESNRSLAERRAGSVRDALLAIGVDPGRLTVIGVGEGKPVAGNDTSSGRARNRRVEVIVEGAK